MNPRLNNKHSLLSKSGSFWADTVSEATKDMARSFVHIPTHSRHESILEEAQRNMEGSSHVWVDNVDLPFSEDSILTLDRRTQERIVENHEGVFVTFRPSSYTAPFDNHDLLFIETEEFAAIATEHGDLLFFPSSDSSSHIIINDYRPIYFVPIPNEYKPSAIWSSSGHLMLVGVDFQVGDGVLVLWEHPRNSFDRSIRIAGGTKEKRSIMSFSYKLESVSGKVDYIAAYNRDNQSVRSYALAAAQASGQVVCPVDAVVQGVRNYKRGKLYLFDGFSLDVPYEHEALEAGTLIERDTIIGGHIDVRSGSGSSWYRDLDWREGLSLDGICPIKGLTIPDAQIRIDTVSEEDDFHARPHLRGSDDALSRYWNFIAKNENITGVFLNGVIGLTSLSDVVYTNGIDLFFDNLIGNRAVVAKLRTRSLGNLYHSRALAFLNREKPVGSVLIIKEELYTPALYVTPS